MSSCWSIPRESGWTHRSTILPSSMRVKRRFWTSNDRFVGATPMNSPSCVPLSVTRRATRSSCVTASSTVAVKSEKPSRKAWMLSRQASMPRASWPNGPCSTQSSA